MPLSEQETARYARHFSLPGVGQAGQVKLKSSRVLVIGAGGLGSPVALYLAAAGVGKITIVDPDHVALSNLQRQVLFTTPDVGRPKVRVACERLRHLNPEIEIGVVKDSFSSFNAAALVSAHDLVVDGTDNFATRYLVNDTCVSLKRPLVFGAIARFDAQVGVFVYRDGPCYRCVFPEAPQAESVPDCSAAGVLGALPGTVGTLMAMEVLKILLQVGEPLSGRLLIYDALAAEFRGLAVPRREDCAGCGTGVALGTTSYVAPAPASEARTIRAQELRVLLGRPESHVLIDVRSEAEFSNGHLPGASNIPLARLEAEQERMTFGLPVILVCATGLRSARGVEILRAKGLTKVSHLAGGIEAFTQSSF